MSNSFLEQSTITHEGGFIASTPAPGGRSRTHIAANSNLGSEMDTCKQCGVESPQNELKFCYSCGIAIHALCIAPMIAKSGVCVCGDSCAFLPFSATGTKKRLHLDLSKSSLIDESLSVPDPLVFADFRQDLKDEATISDFAKSLGAYLDSNQKREDNKAIQQANSLATVKLQVSSNSNNILRMSKTVQRHDSSLALFELTVGGIHGDVYDDVRKNFISLCKFLKVKLDESDIAYLRFLKKDVSRKQIKSHNIAIRLHSSKLVSQIINARGNFRKNHQHQPLKHSEIFPETNATNRIIYIRRMLSEFKYQLLKLASDVKTRLGYKYCWATDNGTILIKKDDSSDPIVIRDETSLSALESPGD